MSDHPVDADEVEPDVTATQFAQMLEAEFEQLAREIREMFDFARSNEIRVKRRAG